jgi:hypothetical protein
MAISLLVLGALALVFAVFVQTQASDAAERAVPIDPNNAGPDAVLAEAAGVAISTPIRPANLTGSATIPEGESLVKMTPRGENLSATAFLGLLSTGETPEKIHYYLMDAAGRGGSKTRRPRRRRSDGHHRLRARDRRRSPPSGPTPWCRTLTS